MLSELIFGVCVTVSGVTNCDKEGPPPPYPLPSDGTELNLEIGAVSVNSPPQVTFTVTNEDGSTVVLTQDDIASGALRFGIAKLVPGQNGDADSWQSYINTVEEATPDVGPDGSPVLASAMQATVEARNNAGTLTQNDDESYTYTFKTDITDPSQTMGVTYDPSLTHRVAMQVEFEGADGEEIVANPYFDFVPTGSAVTTNKKVTHKDECNDCHHELAIHGGGRIETEYCVVCHNPGTTDANSGNNLDFSTMVHKIHMGEDLSSPYTIWGFRDSEHDYSTVVYPQDHRNCAKCHSAENELTPQGDNWKLRPTMEACGSCHDQTDFNNHPDEGISQKDNFLCGQCHVPFSSKLYFAVENAHTNPVDVLAEQFRYNILSTVYIPQTRRVFVFFTVTDPTNDNERYDIETHPAFTAGGGASRMAILIGWNTSDIANQGSGEAAAQPISIDPLFGNAVKLPNKSNVFRVDAVLPPEASGTGVVAIEGHPAVDGVRIPVANVVDNFVISGEEQERRLIVSIDKCNACHENLSLHGNNRQGTTEVCVICHNPDATDIDVRPPTIDDDGDGVFDDFTAVGIDGLREEAIHFKTMVHAIHAGAAEEHGYRENGIVVYGFRRSVHDYSHVRYPGILSNCNACHVDDSYQVSLPEGVLATTWETASPELAGDQEAMEHALRDASDDLNVSAETAACASCHDSPEAMDHMGLVGKGVFGETQDFIDEFVFEDCGGCHGPHEFKDVAEVHDLH